MNIRTLTPTLNHVTPDVENIHTNRDKLKDAIIELNDIYLPTLQEKINALNVHLNRVEDAARNIFDLAPLALRSSGIRTMLQSIHETDEGSAFRPGYVAELTDYIDSALEEVTDLTRALSGSLDTLNTFDPGKTAGFAVDMARQIGGKRADLELISQRKADTQADKDAINAAMRVLEDKSLFDELIPLVEALRHINPQNPYHSVIKIGVAAVVNILRIGSESVKYKDMVDARAEVQKRLDTFQQQQREAKQQISTLEARVQQLKTLEPVALHQANYEQEIRKIPRTLEAFLNGQHTLPRTDMLEYARIFIAQANDMAVYLEDLSNRWK